MAELNVPGIESPYRDPMTGGLTPAASQTQLSDASLFGSNEGLSLGDPQVSSYYDLMASSGANALSGGLTAANGIMGAIGSIFQAKTIREQAKTTQQSAEFRAKMADYNSRATMIAAKESAQLLKIQGGRAISAGKASYAGQGVKVTGGGAGNVVDRFEKVSTSNINDDAVTLIANARNEAYGYGLAAMQARTAGRMAAQDGRYEANASLLGGIARGGTRLMGGALKVGGYA